MPLSVSLLARLCCALGFNLEWPKPAVPCPLILVILVTRQSVLAGVYCVCPAVPCCLYRSRVCALCAGLYVRLQSVCIVCRSVPGHVSDLGHLVETSDAVQDARSTA